jgi:hypothetical protein
MRTALWICALLAASRLLSAQTAVEKYKAILDQAQSARKAGDVKARIAAITRLEELTNHSPRSVLSAAAVLAIAGNEQLALDSLQEFADMGQGDDLLVDGKRQEFASLAANPRYIAILDQIKRNEAAVKRAEEAIEISDAGLLPEDIDFDSKTRSFLVTSVLERKIVRIAMSGKITAFADSPSHWPMLAIKIDAARGLVWATEVALDGFSLVDKEQWGRSAVLCFELKTGRLIHRTEGPAHTSLGDMSLAADGTPVVSDGQGGAIYRLAGERLEMMNNHDFISPQTPTSIPGTTKVFVPDYTRGVGILDVAKDQVKWLGSAGKKRTALNGVDGLYYFKQRLILVQNGTAPERVVMLHLDHDLTHVVSEETIEQVEPRLGDPTHGVIVGGEFYFIANSGWNHLDDHGDLNKGEQLTPAMIMRFKLN